MAQTRAATSEGSETERPSKRAKVEPQTDFTEGNAVDASLEKDEREESPFSDDNVEDTTKAVQGSDLYLDTVRLDLLSIINRLVRYCCALMLL